MKKKKDNLPELLKIKFQIEEEFGVHFRGVGGFGNAVFFKENIKPIPAFSKEEVLDFVRKNKQIAVLHSCNYQRKLGRFEIETIPATNKLVELQEVEISKISIFLNEIKPEIVSNKFLVNLQFVCFWNGSWNNITLKVREDKIILYNFLNKNNTALKYKGLGHYFMSFVKILAIKLGLPIILQASESAVDFYKKENFVEIENGKMVWENKPKITKDNLI